MEKLQRDITQGMRGILIDWLVEVSHPCYHHLPFNFINIFSFELSVASGDQFNFHGILCSYCYHYFQFSVATVRYRMPRSLILRVLSLFCIYSFFLVSFSFFTFMPFMYTPLSQVSEEYRLVPDTLYLTVNLIDRFLSENYIEKQKLQLLGVTCMLISS